MSIFLKKYYNLNEWFKKTKGQETVWFNIIDRPLKSWLAKRWEYCDIKTTDTTDRGKDTFLRFWRYDKKFIVVLKGSPDLKRSEPKTSGRISKKLLRKGRRLNKIQRRAREINLWKERITRWECSAKNLISIFIGLKITWHWR